MAAILCPTCQALQRQIDVLRQEVQRLTQLLDQNRRRGQRQAAPFSKGEPKDTPQKPGRKSGAKHGIHGHRPPPSPDQIDEVHEASLPETCPDCGGPIHETGVAQQYQTEIPRKPIHRQFNVHLGRCGGCDHAVQGRHPLQTSNALGAAASQLGPDAQAALVELNKSAGLSHGKIVRVFRQLFGIALSRGGSAQAMLRAARRCQPVYSTICQAVRASPWVVPDETGWRVGGRGAWLHAFVGRTATAYVIARRRDHTPAANLLGLDYAGTLIHDGWSPYDRFTRAAHQQCHGHLLRRCHELLETAVGGAVRFPRQVKAWLQQALAVRDRFEAGQISWHGVRVAAGRLRMRAYDFIWPRKTHAGNERFAQHLAEHLDDLFTFLKIPGLDATNWRAEQAIRPAVVNRKVWGGNRTDQGAEAQAILMSVWQTCDRATLSALDFVSLTLRDLAPRLLLA